jgi:hypothetical protein
MANIQLRINSPEMQIASWTIYLLLLFSSTQRCCRQLLLLRLALHLNFLVSLNFWAFTCALAFNSNNFSLICNKAWHVNILKWIVENWIKNAIRHHILLIFVRLLLRIGLFFPSFLWIPLLVVLSWDSSAVLLVWFSSAPYFYCKILSSLLVWPVLSKLGLIERNALLLFVTLWVIVFGFDS